MNKNKAVRIPRLAIEPKLEMTVIKSVLRSFQERTILNILKSLNALKTDRPPPSFDEASSTKLTMTTILSKMLKFSDKYDSNPNANILTTISRPKTIVKIKFPIS